MELRLIIEAEYQICREINFISGEQISEEFWQESYNLVREVDIKDIPYVAYAKQFDCKIWSGDNKLIKGLKSKGYLELITTDDLCKIKNELKGNL